MDRVIPTASRIEGRQTSAAFVDAAITAALQLLENSSSSAKGITWRAPTVVGISEQDRPLIAVREIGPTMYDGTAGISYALSAVARVAQDVGRPKIAELLHEGAAQSTETALAEANDLLQQGRLGFFDGTAGVAIAAYGGNRESDARELNRETRTRLVATTASLETATHDLLGGTAGVILGLLASSEQPVAQDLSAAADMLCDAAETQVWGAAWPSPAQGDGAVPLVGLAHGAAGVALALDEMSAIGGPSRWSVIAEAAREYERGWFDRDRSRWPDLRGASDESPIADLPASSAWCSGAVGIGLSRLRSWHLSHEPIALAEVSAALQAARDHIVAAGTALKTGASTDCTNCHGLAGIAELFLVAARVLQVPEHARAATRVAQLMLEQRTVTQGWPCGLVGAGELPGLMTGIAGIVLTLLRVAGAIGSPTPLLPGPAGW